MSRSVLNRRWCVMEPESLERQFVRWVYRHPEYERMPYQPASREHRPRPGKLPPINDFLASLSAVGCSYRPARCVDEWEALCPTHEDTRASLVVRRNGDGSVWFKCWAGCSKEGILHALGLSWRDLWDQCERDYGRRDYRAPLLPANVRRAMLDLLARDDST